MREGPAEGAVESEPSRASIERPAGPGGTVASDRQRPRERSGFAGAVREIVVTLVLAASLYFLIQTFVAQTYRVEMQSMEPTLEPGYHLLIDKLTPRFDSYSRGDIVVFHPPQQRRSSDDVPFIKRVIGVPGDTVEIRDERVYVNGVALDEPYLPEGEPTLPDDEATSWTVGEGELFLMGDHRTASRDSRSSTIGMVPVSEVIGRAWLGFWPLDTFGVIQTPTYPDVPAAP